MVSINVTYFSQNGAPQHLLCKKKNYCAELLKFWGGARGMVPLVLNQEEKQPFLFFSVCLIKTFLSINMQKMLQKAPMTLLKLQNVLFLGIQQILLKDIQREKAPSNKTPALIKSRNMGIWVVGTSNQLVIGGS